MFTCGARQSGGLMSISRVLSLARAAGAVFYLLYASFLCCSHQKSMRTPTFALVSDEPLRMITLPDIISGVKFGACYCYFCLYLGSHLEL